MKIFLHKLTVSCMFCTMVVCFALAGCQDVVRRVDDKYRPVKEPGSVTVLADRADDLGVPIQIKNLSVDELELKVSSSDNSPVPFVPILEEGVQLDDVFSPDMLGKTIQEEREIRRENVRRLAEKRFPQEERIYYQE